MSAVSPSAFLSWDRSTFSALDALSRRPVRDLLESLPPITPASVVDLGCGSGSVTRLLAAQWPEVDVMGVDPSPALLQWAQSVPSRVRYEQADLSVWRPSWPVDLLLSFGGLQAVPHHERLFPEFLQCLAPGGLLAVALPRPEALMAHRLLLDTAANGPWAGRLADALHPPPHGAQDYYNWLSPLAVSVELWETEHHHVLSGDTPILQWLRSDALAPVMERLAGVELDRFLADYRARLEAAYPEHPFGNTLVPTRHLFIVARVAG